MTADETLSSHSIGAFPEVVAGRINRGARFCGLFASTRGDDTQLIAVLAENGSLDTEKVVVSAGAGSYPSLTSRVPAAAWYEREIRDLFGLHPDGHPRLDPLILPMPSGSARPRPGSGVATGALELDLTPLHVHLAGEGVFTIPYGPVRSGVFEAVEYVVETPGETIPLLRTRVFYKHRGVESRFAGMSVDDGVLLAERCEGVASVAHAIAFCGAVERLAGVDASTEAGLVRVLHAELERVANHLDSTIRHTEAAGQAVAFSRFSLHKERVQRLRARLCGSRFSRGVVVPGGVAGPPALDATEVRAAIGQLEAGISADARLLLATPSFVDRLRETGVITPEIAHRYWALGPIGRGSGQSEDVRFARPYGAYGRLGHPLLEPRDEGDALARQRVRLDEIDGSFHLIRQAVDDLGGFGDPDRALWRRPLPDATGETLGWAEAPQGEVLYLVELDEGRIVRAKPRSASFHNLALFSMAFPNDILTDFAFIEASFGVSIAGVAN
jgi:Ni,Fe-hydrogenase III large subunit